MKITSLPQYRRDAKRFTEIVRILGRYGLAQFVGRNDPEFVKKLFKTAEGERLTDLTPGERLRMALTELGTTFIKLGQILSTRADIVGPEVAEELAKLQSSTPADPPDAVRTLIESELGRSVEEAFAEFEPQPLASASIGQVHRARLHDGSDVVVKVQHAGIEQTVLQDMEIFEALAAIAEKYDEETAQYQPRAVAAEFRRSILRELDFAREARSLEVFARHFADDDGVHIPRVYPAVSSRRVLTMERLVGYSISDRERLETEGVDRKALALRGANLYLEMVFRDGMYHADPHPGNIFVLADGVIGLLDFGMVGRLDGGLREDLEAVLVAVMEQDGDGLTRAVVRLGSAPMALDRRVLRADIEDFIAEYALGDIAQLRLSSALSDLTDIIRRHKILLAGNVSMLLRVLIMLEGTSRSLDRSFSLMEVMQPYMRKIVGRRFGPKELLEDARRRGREWGRLVDRAPRDLSDILTRISEGRFDVYLEHRRLDPSVNKLVLGIVASALFLGSTQVLAAKVPPLIGEISILGALGSVVAAVLGWRLVRAIHRSQDLG